MTDGAHMLKGFTTAVGVNGGMVDSSLSLVGVPLVEVQQRQQLLPALAIHDLAQAICPLGKALAILCMTHYCRLNKSSHFPKHAVHGLHQLHPFSSTHRRKEQTLWLVLLLTRQHITRGSQGRVYRNIFLWCTEWQIR